MAQLMFWRSAIDRCAGHFFAPGDWGLFSRLCGSEIRMKARDGVSWNCRWDIAAATGGSSPPATDAAGWECRNKRR